MCLGREWAELTNSKTPERTGCRLLSAWPSDYSIPRLVCFLFFNLSRRRNVISSSCL